jgi:hypothetical protein
MVKIWTKSTFCADRACVEVARIGEDKIALRDGKNLDQPYLTFSTQDWTSFLDGVASGQFEVR